MKVLLVDDERELVSAMAERLTIRGIEADWVSTGSEALELADRETYDVAVLDVKMPVMSGLELMKEMERKNPDLKFIFLTGHGSEKDFQTYMAEEGTSFYLVKPIRIEELIAKIHAALGMKE
ncbi:MAG: response regulator [Proteobacteria bacterium]|nr:response regulator [Pseudomonadota bacterium]